MEEQNEQERSKYSSGININLRLDQLWKDTHTHSRAGKFYLWNLDLDCIWSELARDLKAKENDSDKNFDNINKNFKKYDEKLKETGNIKDSKPEGFEEPTKEQLDNRNKQYEILREKQIFLARLENKLGKGTTWEDEDEDDM
jgi:hypothetical protein